MMWVMTKLFGCYQGRWGFIIQFQAIMVGITRLRWQKLLRIPFQDIRNILILFSLRTWVHTWHDYGMTTHQHTNNMGYINSIKELSQDICWRLREKIIMGLSFTHKKKPSLRGLREPPTSAIKLVSAAKYSVTYMLHFVNTSINAFLGPFHLYFRNCLASYLDKLGVWRV